ncbi:MAG: hypothetical protein P1U40_02280 [Coxiellaceae bacterium]|nr:hypothetical protein [Coxiellaceae bacterium]
MRPELSDDELKQFIKDWDSSPHPEHNKAYHLDPRFELRKAVLESGLPLEEKRKKAWLEEDKRRNAPPPSSVDSTEDPWAVAFAEAGKAEAQLAREAALPKPATPEGRSEYHDPFAGAPRIKADDAWMDKLIAKEKAARAATSTSKRSAITVGPLATMRAAAREQKPSVKAPVARRRVRKQQRNGKGSPGKAVPSPYAVVPTPVRQRKLRPLGSVKKNRKPYFSTSQQEKFNKLCDIYGVKPGRVVKSRPLPRHTPLRRADSSAFAAGPARTFGDLSVMSTLRIGEPERPGHLHDNAAEAREHIRQDLDKIDFIAEPGEKLTALHAVKELHSEYVTFNVLDNLGDSASDIHAEIRARNEGILNSMLPASNYDRRPAVPPGLRVSPIEVDTTTPVGSSYAGSTLFSRVVQRSGEKAGADDLTTGTGAPRPRGPGRSSGDE